MNRGVKIIAGLLVLLLSGCSGKLLDLSLTRHFDHNYLQKDESQPYARVYFLRPNSEHPLGFSDNSLVVEVDGQRLLRMGKGEYTLLYMKPRQMTITTRNKTQLRGRWEVEEMSRSRTFTFADGETYYIVLKPFDGEFRGVHFTPEQVALYQARDIADKLVSAGRAIREPVPAPKTDPTR